jgi:NADPH-dependent 2,4-dienoyl-CoA reductase/sulfur reductase-like enzyme/rhodanese-related sulfurtransferase
MPTKNRIVVIGGTACGPKAAARARRCDPNAEITIIEQRDNLSTATCGLPYYISGVIAQESALVTRSPQYFNDVFDMDVFIGSQATAINPKAHTLDVVYLKKQRPSTLEYDKLVIATGSFPTVPPWEGRDLKGIFTLSTIPDANAIRTHLASLAKKEVVIVGAGLIGLEMAENFAAAGCAVTVIEALGWPLPTLLDADVAVFLEKHLTSKGVKMLFGQRVTGFRGDSAGSVRQVLAGDTAYDAGLVLLALGVKPNVALAKAAGLTVGATGGLAVNEYLQTSDPDIYAGGDCAETVNLITGKKTLVPLGSTANKQGRVIGTNVTGGRDTFPGIVGTGVAKVFDINVARTGLNEKQARDAGYEVTVAINPDSDHAGYYPGSRDILIKLIAEKSTGRLLGGQIVGPGEAAKRIDVLATALTFGAKAADLANLDLGYAPPYNSAMDPLHHAANIIRNKQDGLARTISPQEVKRKLDSGEDFVLLDVRSLKEWQEQHIEAKQARLIPLPELRWITGDLPKDKEIITYCRLSPRAYKAQRILDGAGCNNVRFMDGSLAAWPYETVSGDPGKQ